MIRFINDLKFPAERPEGLTKTEGAETLDFK